MKKSILILALLLPFSSFSICVLDTCGILTITLGAICGGSIPAMLAATKGCTQRPECCEGTQSSDKAEEKVQLIASQPMHIPSVVQPTPTPLLEQKTAFSALVKAGDLRG